MYTSFPTDKVMTTEASKLEVVAGSDGKPLPQFSCSLGPFNYLLDFLPPKVAV